MAEYRIEHQIHMLRRNCDWQRSQGTSRDNGYPYGKHLPDCDICRSAELITDLQEQVAAMEKIPTYGEWALQRAEIKSLKEQVAAMESPPMPDDVAEMIGTLMDYSEVSKVRGQALIAGAARMLGRLQTALFLYKSCEDNWHKQMDNMKVLMERRKKSRDKARAKVAALEDELTNLLDKVGDLPREWRRLFEVKS